MTIPRVRPDFEADERSQLAGWLNLQRAIVHWKCEGLAEADAHRSVLPDSPLMTMAGLVSHLRWVEHCWFEVLFLDRGREDNPQFQESAEEDADFMVGDVPLATLLDDYRRQCAVSDEILAAHPLDTVGRNRDFGSGRANLRWMMLHMIEETARHAGHADTIRELLDSGKGYY
ncbi:DinB family protein [Actinophytocola gossypii]|uniref:DinB family protein n=1 Tax=Actinophytocola gossypii TaxID=2812003 RepID=UPI0021A261A6|nr:DinB family protein [Actinophytocola gossypii]